MKNKKIVLSKLFLIVIIFFSIFCCFYNKTFGNENIFDKIDGSIYFEIIGAGVFSSFNIDLIFYNSFLIRYGIVYNKYNKGFLFGLGGLINFKENNFIEFGSGYVKILEGFGENTWHIFILCGYRYQPDNLGISFRLNISPLIKYLKYEFMTLEEQLYYKKDTIKLILWIGVSVGLSF
ncbi:MAG: hypothetical protein N3A58_06465 [Spirochaetes bacterium]|nr:hypothetical protein [Spirochaetota bacterium]